jgi:hypothetical protein
MFRLCRSQRTQPRRRRPNELDERRPSVKSQDEGNTCLLWDIDGASHHEPADTHVLADGFNLSISDSGLERNTNWVLQIEATTSCASQLENPGLSTSLSISGVR